MYRGRVSASSGRSTRSPARRRRAARSNRAASAIRAPSAAEVCRAAASWHCCHQAATGAWQPRADCLRRQCQRAEETVSVRVRLPAARADLRNFRGRSGDNGSRTTAGPYGRTLGDLRPEVRDRRHSERRAHRRTPQSSILGDTTAARSHHRPSPCRQCGSRLSLGRRAAVWLSASVERRAEQFLLREPGGLPAEHLLRKLNHDAASPPVEASPSPAAPTLP